MGTEGEALFAGKTGTGMEVGAVVNGNLRLKVDLADGTLAVLELPHRWLVGRGGLRSFIEDNCHPGGPKPFVCQECRNHDCNECCVIDGFRGSCQCSCAGGPTDEEDREAQDYEDAQEGLLPPHAFGIKEKTRG